MKKSISRRKFIRNSSAAALGLTVVPSHVVSGLGHVPPSDKLNIAGIGVGGKGVHNLNNMVGQKIVALCDVDWAYAKPVFEKYPKAKRYKDFRVMFEKERKIDAVVIATPDHTHYHPAKLAMELGKHVYVQKPLTHSIWEARELSRLAREYKVATQMGTEGHSSDSVREVTEILQAGVIGEIREIHTWTNRPIWPQGMDRFPEEPPVPETLDWNLFLGPAKYRPYHPAYTPWSWRAWWDYGTGALGDMGCHVLDVPFYAMKLGFPTAFSASSSSVNIETAPWASRVDFHFPERKTLPDVNLPKVKLTWHDGGLLPERPEELPDGEVLGSWGGGNLFIGTDGKLVCANYGDNYKLLPMDKTWDDVPETQERIPDHELGGGRHEMDWVRACKEDPETRKEACSNFELTGPLTEMVLAGNLAIRLQHLNRILEWDGDNMQIKNIDPNEKFNLITARPNYKDGKWTPYFHEETKEVNALAIASEWIKHTYREF
jgi:predicted dehydrogenase